MQKIIVVFMAAVMMVSCGKKYGNFVVKGKITNVPADQWLYVEKASFSNDTANTITDSVKLKAGGEFELKSSGKEEGLYMLTVGHNPIAIFINDEPTVNITLDVNSTRYPVFSGSDGSAKLYDFISKYRHTDSILREISGQVTAMQQQQAPETAIQPLQVQFTSQLDSLNREIKNIVHTSSHPALICFVLDKAGSSESPKGMDSLVNEATSRFKEHTGIAVIKTLIKQAATADQQKQQQQQQQDPSADNYPLLNQQAPDLAMTGINGKPLSISSFKGKYLLVDFWASWCGPCRGENPNVVTAYNMYKNKNFTILGVSLDDNQKDWEEAVKKDGLTWNHMSDLKQWQSAAVNTYQFNGIPFNVLIDPNGKIIASSLRGPALEAKLAEVLK